MKYCQQIYEIDQKVHEKQVSLVNQIDPILLQDNVQQYVLQIIIHQLKELELNVLLP